MFTLVGTVCILFLDIIWNKEWFSNIPKFPKFYWKSKENQKKLLDGIARKLNITNPKDWGKVQTLDVQLLGGTSLLNRYNNSLFACLQSVYSGFNTSL